MFVGSILYGHLAIPLFWIGSKWLATTAQKWMQVEFTITPWDRKKSLSKIWPTRSVETVILHLPMYVLVTLMVNRSKLHGSYGILSMVHSRSLRTCTLCILSISIWENQSNVRKDDPIDSRRGCKSHWFSGTWWVVRLVQGLLFSSPADTSQTKIEQTTGWCLSKTRKGTCKGQTLAKGDEKRTWHWTSQLMLQQPKV